MCVRVSLLAAGFVVGPGGTSVRDVSRATGAEIRSHTESFVPPGSTGRPCAARTFTLSGRHTSVVAALDTVAAAVDLYVALTSGACAGQAVDREQRVRGCTFFYSPPPRAAVPQAAALRTPGSGTGASPERGAAVTPAPLQLTPLLGAVHPAAVHPSATDPFVLVPIRASVAAAAAAAVSCTPLTAADGAAELLAALQACAVPSAAPAASQPFSAPTPNPFDAPCLQRCASDIPALLADPVAWPELQVPSAPAHPCSASVRRALVLERQPAGELGLLLAAEHSGEDLAPLGAPLSVTLERQPAGELGALLAAEASAATAAPGALPCGGGVLLASTASAIAPASLGGAESAALAALGLPAWSSFHPSNLPPSAAALFDHSSC